MGVADALELDGCLNRWVFDKAKIEEANLTVGSARAPQSGRAEKLCRDVAADDNVLPAVYGHVDVTAGSGRIIADCFVP